MALTVYTKPSCVQCTSTYRSLDNAGLAYDVLDVTADDAALETVKSLGYLQAPVVTDTDDQGVVIEHWSGFRPDKIADYVKSLDGARELVAA
jgi:glutaredoxin-like protein NrdH